MLGVLITVAVALGWTSLALRWVRRWIPAYDEAAQWGFAVLLGLGCLGWMTLPIGLLPGGLKWGIAVVGGGAVVGLFGLRHPAAQAPTGAAWAAMATLVLAILFALMGALAPSTALDWDSLAYHLAVPKIWNQSGQIVPISFIHHSNFPFVVDNLFVWGLQWGGTAGAKTFSVAFLAAGCLAIFGVARQRYGATAGWWSAVAFATVPVVLWESGTAYIDVAHGLYAGLGTLLLLLPTRGRGALTLGALFLGFAVASKYTGLQTVFAVGLVLATVAVRERVSARGSLAALALAVAIGAPWYLKNVAWTGNPVFPFFYERLGGKNWDAFSAKIYREEQKTFGVSLDSPNAPAHAILGLAYQPGRYNNPNPRLDTSGNQPQGATGLPFGAVGAALLAAALCWGFAGGGTFERRCLGAVAVSLGLWLALSQQSRYIVSLAPLLCVLLGAGVVRLRAGPLLAGGTAVQAAYSLFLMHSLVVADQMRVAFGQVSAPAYQSAAVPFAEPAAAINQLKPARVALYDEVFGSLLDVPYFWANPGHTTEIGYERLADGDALVDSLARLGISHVYLNLGFQDPGFRGRWLEAMGIDQPARPFDPAEKEALNGDLRTKWKVLLAEAVAGGRLVEVRRFKASLLFEVRR